MKSVMEISSVQKIKKCLVWILLNMNMLKFVPKPIMQDMCIGGNIPFALLQFLIKKSAFVSSCLEVHINLDMSGQISFDIS